MLWSFTSTLERRRVGQSPSAGVDREGTTAFGRLGQFKPAALDGDEVRRYLTDYGDHAFHQRADRDPG